MIGFKNGEFVDESQVTVPVDSLMVNRGYGAFEFLGIKNGNPFYMERHMARFQNSLKMLRLSIPYSIPDVQMLVQSLIEKNNLTDFHLKLFALPLSNSYSEPLIETGLFMIPVIMPVYPTVMYQTGTNLILKEYTRFLPQVKSTSYMPSVLWQNEVEEAKALDVLYHTNRIIRETSRGNIFMVRQNQVLTPGSLILKGITRSIVLELLIEKHISVSETEVPSSDLFSADEVFVTSTTKEIVPIVRIDKQVIGNGKPGPVTRMVMEEFKKLKESY